MRNILKYNINIIIPKDGIVFLKIAWYFMGIVTHITFCPYCIFIFHA
jgi:hypothetical protein